MLGKWKCKRLECQISMYREASRVPVGEVVLKTREERETGTGTSIDKEITWYICTCLELFNFDRKEGVTRKCRTRGIYHIRIHASHSSNMVTEVGFSKTSNPFSFHVTNASGIYLFICFSNAEWMRGMFVHMQQFPLSHKCCESMPN